MKQTPLKRSQPRRLWVDARAKCDVEEICRLCGSPHPEAAHIVDRSRDAFTPEGERREQPWHVHPNRIVPLCRPCHAAFDRHEIEVLAVLTLSEQLQAVRDSGGLELARVRLAPLAYTREAAA